MHCSPPAIRKRAASVTGRAAMTLVELLVTITILAVLTAIAMPIYSNIHKASERALANDHIEALNRGVNSYSQNCWKFPTAPDASSSADELAVVRSLQFQFPASMLKPGSPYFDPRYDPPASADETHVRIQWNGKSFELIETGTSGTGLRFNSSENYFREPYSFPSGYKPEGAQ